jgi:hypothetical protein
MATQQITINRAPVLTLWAAVVAERLGYDHDTAVTLGKAVAGLNAQSKARRLGMIEDAPDPDHERKSRARKTREAHDGAPAGPTGAGDHHGPRRAGDAPGSADRAHRGRAIYSRNSARPCLTCGPPWKRWPRHTRPSNWRPRPLRCMSSFAQQSPRGHEAGALRGAVFPRRMQPTSAPARWSLRCVCERHADDRQCTGRAA